MPWFPACETITVTAHRVMNARGSADSHPVPSPGSPFALRASPLGHSGVSAAHGKAPEVVQVLPASRQQQSKKNRVDLFRGSRRAFFIALYVVEEVLNGVLTLTEAMASLPRPSSNSRRSKVGLEVAGGLEEVSRLLHFRLLRASDLGALSHLSLSCYGPSRSASPPRSLVGRGVLRIGASWSQPGGCRRLWRDSPASSCGRPHQQCHEGL